jgi:cellulose synthase/poly-beta-1,6-N-acetylglucosamine synthase-like glycosyltransferase
LFYAWLLELATIGLSYEISELLLLLIVRGSKINRVSTLEDCPPVALLCVTCDDVNISVLQLLGNQTYPNTHIFILDDSELDESRFFVDSSGFHVIRRPDRKGYKAGNLNNWLNNYSSCFPYFVVADADSILPPDFIERMVSYAEHDDNKNVTIFESLILPWNKENEFVHCQSIMIPLVNRRRLRVDNMLDTTLSVGHNNLYRTSDIIAVGGFQEQYIAEDYATCMEVMKKKEGGCKTVPVVSYERLPSNLNEYARRQARWAYQTFQLLKYTSSGLSLNIYLIMLRAFHHYSTPVIASIGMLLLSFYNFKYGPSLSCVYNNQEIIMQFIEGKVFIYWGSLLLFPLLLRILLCKIERIPILQYIKSMVFQTAIFIATIWPVIYRLRSCMVDDKIGYNVTGTAPYPSLYQIIMLGLPGFSLAWVAMLSVASNPVFSSLNLIWILPSSISPFLIFHYQKVSA